MKFCVNSNVLHFLCEKIDKLLQICSNIEKNKIANYMDVELLIKHTILFVRTLCVSLDIKTKRH